jgi:DNA sulfur modification protein DndC
MIVDEIWYIINTVKSPWDLIIHSFQNICDASADDYECPTVVVDKEHSSCGQSRFGCWTLHGCEKMTNHIIG